MIRLEGSVNNTAQVLDFASVLEGASVDDDAIVMGHAVVRGRVREQAIVSGHAAVLGDVYGEAQITGNASVSGRVGDNARIGGDAAIPSEAEIGRWAVIQSKYGSAHGRIGSETWDAYTCWDGKKWFVMLRFACKAQALSCWEDEGKVKAHARDISYSRAGYWEEAIERVRDLAREIVVIPQAPPQFEAWPSPARSGA